MNKVRIQDYTLLGMKAPRMDMRGDGVRVHRRHSHSLNAADHGRDRSSYFIRAEMT